MYSLSGEGGAGDEKGAEGRWPSCRCHSPGLDSRHSLTSRFALVFSSCFSLSYPLGNSPALPRVVDEVEMDGLVNTFSIHCSPPQVQRSSSEETMIDWFQSGLPEAALTNFVRLGFFSTFFIYPTLWSGTDTDFPNFD